MTLTFGERMKKLRKALDLTQQEFADRIGSKRNTVATYEMGRTDPSAAVVSLICREFNVNETWLRTGEGEMLVKVDADDELKQIFEAISVSEDETLKRVIRAYWRLSDSGKAGFREMLDNLVEEYDASGEPLPTAGKDILAASARTEVDTAVQPNPDIAAELAELKRQNQELAAEVAALKEEDARRETAESPSTEEKEKKPTPVSEDGPRNADEESFMRAVKAMVPGLQEQLFEQYNQASMMREQQRDAATSLVPPAAGDKVPESETPDQS